MSLVAIGWVKASFANALLMEAVCVAMSRDVIKEALGAVANVVPTEVADAAVKKDAVS